MVSKIHIIVFLSIILNFSIFTQTENISIQQYAENEILNNFVFIKYTNSPEEAISIYGEPESTKYTELDTSESPFYYHDAIVLGGYELKYGDGTYLYYKFENDQYSLFCSWIEEPSNNLVTIN